MFEVTLELHEMPVSVTRVRRSSTVWTEDGEQYVQLEVKQSLEQEVEACCFRFWNRMCSRSDPVSGNKAFDLRMFRVTYLRELKALPKKKAFAEMLHQSAFDKYR